MKKALIICSKADKPSEIPNTSISICHKCKCSVWISPSSQKVMMSHDTDILCLACAIQEAQTDKDIRDILLNHRFTREQLQEIKGVLKEKFKYKLN